MTKVLIYNTPNCIYCQIAKKFFKDHNVAYEEKDVSVDDEAREEMIAKSGQLGVPVVDIDGKIIVGFDEAAIKGLLKL